MSEWKDKLNKVFKETDWMKEEIKKCLDEKEWIERRTGEILCWEGVNERKN
jgi:hypothetical protein